ncbi:serine/threonine-protein kinase [Actinoplanes sp. NPDC049802]|uniref:serine/threonine-protein kinase n=1 Tax=Actinoplanes sp. NPDC049802 TaxID=3154742 RepID=UPI0033E397B1
MVRYVLNDRYELRSLLGRGGMAQVWQGFDRWLGRMVAVKVLHERVLADPSVPARFEREARTVAGLTHPNIVTLHDVGADRGVPYLVMELVEGRSLADLLSAGPLDVAGAARIAAQVCAALEAASAAGVVHRDIKPANILVTGDGRVKVCDFGIARVAGTVQGELTGSAQMLGTSTYMAPEQVAGGPVDVRTDLYGLGCVLYAMLTGGPPFTGDSPMRIAWDHVERSPQPVSRHRRVPQDLDRLLLAMLAKFPADRPSGPAAVRAVLENLNTEATGEQTDAESLEAVRSPAVSGGGPEAVRPPAVSGGDLEAVRSPAVTGGDPEAAAPTAPEHVTARPSRAGGRRGRLVLAGVAAVVGAGALAMTTAGAGDPGARAAPAPNGPPPASAPPRPGAAEPDGTAARNEPTRVIGPRAGTGDIDEKSARDLIKKLEKENNGKGRNNAEVRRKLNELRRTGKLQEATYQAILAELESSAM